MNKKEIKECKKILRRKILAIMEVPPDLKNLPDDAPEVRQIRQLGKALERLRKQDS